MNKSKLREYAKITVRLGANVQKGQDVFLSCPVVCAEFGRMIMEEAYAAGAAEVIMNYFDEKASRIKYLNSDISVFENVPAWEIERRNYYGRRHAAMITVLAEDPEINAGVPGEKLLAAARARHKAFEEYYKMMDAGDICWTLVAYPIPEWASKVFPDATPAHAVELLWNAIFKTVRITRGDTVKKWHAHDRMLKKRSKKLNDFAFEAIECKNSLGTDIRIGLPENHVWLGGSDTSTDGISYFPNMPTEEIFTMPHCRKTEGTVFSSMPLSYQGNMIDHFSLTFKNGEVVDFTAEVGRDALARLLETDEGSRRLGEGALIPHDSPISNQKILFYNTLFDENASCHLALGDCYPNTIKGGEQLDREKLGELGGNHSANHVDFMFGTPDMQITGIKKDGSTHEVFRDGGFVF